MINYLHSLLNRPEQGWDPISAEHARWYSDIQWSHGVDESLLDELDKWVGGLAGRRVLDLGGGPGHYSVAFAKRNAHVTWHDVSRVYLEIAQRKAAEHHLEIRFSLGYMEDAVKLPHKPFDLVFNRICWYYAFDDSRFADILFDLVKPGGVGYVDTMHSKARDPESSLSLDLRTWLNDRFGVKIGHPLPPHGRIARLFIEKPVMKLVVDYTSITNDKVLFLKK